MKKELQISRARVYIGNVYIELRAARLKRFSRLLLEVPREVGSVPSDIKNSSMLRCCRIGRHFASLAERQSHKLVF
jgi:hypothetical protein